MAEQVRVLTQEALRAQAREAAAAGVPLEEAARHLEHDSKLAATFAHAYAEGRELP